MDWHKYWTIAAQVIMTLVLGNFGAFIIKSTIHEWKTRWRDDD